MVAQAEWNSVFEDLNEDWKAATSSEVFCNYLKIIQAKDAKAAARAEQLKLEEENKKKFKKETDSIMNDVNKAEDASQVPTPLMQNLPYDGDDYQSHVKRTFENRDENGAYDEFYPDLKVYHNKKKSSFTAMDTDQLVKQALAELFESTSTEEESAADDNDETETQSSPVPKTKPSKNESFSNYDDESGYDATDAGESKYIDIGITNETEHLLDDGINYIDTNTSGGKNESSSKKDDGDNDSDDQEVDAMPTETEIEAAERYLGLNKNAFYILMQLSK